MHALNLMRSIFRFIPLEVNDPIPTYKPSAPVKARSDPRTLPKLASTFHEINFLLYTNNTIKVKINKEAKI